MNNELELAPKMGAVTRTEQPQNQGLSIEQVFQAVIEKNISAENIEVMKQLLAMDAEKKFNAAFVKLQSEIPPITATSIIPNRGKYERFEDIMSKVGPLLVRHGFSVSFSMTYDTTRILETCHLRHIGGHSQANSFAVRVGKADSDTQADCKAATTAKRNALLNALNIIIRQDVLQSGEDASLDGGFITKAQADEIEHRCKMANVNMPRFWEFAGATTWATIPYGKYNAIDDLLRRKEKGEK